MLCETRLPPHDLDTDYKMDTFADIVHHDERTGNESQYFHGLAAYVKDHLCLHEIHKQRNEGLESLYLCLHKIGDPQPVQFICMYASPKITFEVLKNNIDESSKNTDVITTRCIIIGDFNMKSVLPNANDYNEKLTEHMFVKYNMKQYVNASTTESGSILDLCFSNCSNIEHVVTWNHMSDHKIVTVILQNEIFTYN